MRVYYRDYLALILENNLRLIFANQIFFFDFKGCIIWIARGLKDIADIR